MDFPDHSEDATRLATCDPVFTAARVHDRLKLAEQILYQLEPQVHDGTNLRKSPLSTLIDRYRRLRDHAEQLIHTRNGSWIRLCDAFDAEWQAFLEQMELLRRPNPERHRQTTKADATPQLLTATP